MSQGSQIRATEDRRLLVERLAASPYFNRSTRLRDLLVYLTDRVLEDDRLEIHEQEVGHQVFGRAPDYDTAADNIVRVHASMLRKRLDQYFSAEGAAEPVTIEIPRGNYAPIFRERSNAAAETLNPAPGADPPPAKPREDWRLIAAMTCAVVFAIATAMLLFREPVQRATATPGIGPAVRQFWGQFLGRDRVTDVVLDDAAVALYQELSGRTISLNEYFDRSYLRNLSAADGAGLTTAAAMSIILRRQSSFADTSFTWKLTQLARTLTAQPNLRFARDYSFRDLKANNAILLGNGRSNPWVQPFEAQLAIHWEFDRASGTYYPVDTRNPDKRFQPQKPGEAHEGYFSLALVPNLGGSGKVLLVAATGGSATNSAADFLADEQALHELRGRLRAGNSPGFPSFEALVKAQGRSSGTRDISVVVCRPVSIK
jgi:hypothetical protein